MRKAKLIPIALVSLFSLSVIPTLGLNVVKADEKTYLVDFFNNYKREQFTLSSGFVGKGNNLLYTTLKVSENSLIEKPTDPTRKNYDFKGWYREVECLNEWDFASTKVTSNVRLYAKWGVSLSGEIVEPPYTPPSTVLDETASVNYEVYSVMNFDVNANTVRLPRAALLRLEDNKENVLPLLEYKVKNSVKLSATYESNLITLDCSGEISTISVIDAIDDYKLNNATYEDKAVKYEQKVSDSENENYHVMLAGSSSIEFWENSQKDLDPIVSYNHGIGGTTIEEWDTKLNQRLVYPFKPKMAVYYVGINNVINSGETAAKIKTRIIDFFNHTHEALPDTKIEYIMMNLIPGFPGKFAIINEVNKAIVDYQKDNPWLVLINPGLALLKENGEPNAAYFRTDGLHLSNYGYSIWGSIIKEAILEGLENM